MSDLLMTIQMLASSDQEFRKTKYNAGWYVLVVHRLGNCTIRFDHDGKFVSMEPSV